MIGETEVQVPDLYVDHTVYFAIMTTASENKSIQKPIMGMGSHHEELLHETHKSPSLQWASISQEHRRVVDGLDFRIPH